MHDLDVPDLIGALADRFEEYDIGPREAAMIAVEMLAHAMTVVDAAADDSLEAAQETGDVRLNAIRRNAHRRAYSH